MSRKGIFFSLIFAVLIAGTLPGILWLREQSLIDLSLQPGDTAMVQLGEQLYAVHCASCHGVSLEGEPNWRTRKANGRLPAPPHDETGHTWHHRDELLFRITKEGTQAVVGNEYQSDMPAFKAMLGDREIIAILSFIKSTWSQEIQQRHDSMSEGGQ